VNVKTYWPITSIIITFDSKLTLSLTVKDNTSHWIKAVDLDSHNALHFEEEISGTFIKSK